MDQDCFSVEVSLERFVSADDERSRVNLCLRRGSGRLGVHWQRLARRLGFLETSDFGARRRIAALRAGALLHPRDPIEALLPGDVITLIPVPESWGGEWSGASDEEDAATSCTPTQPALAATASDPAGALGVFELRPDLETKSVPEPTPVSTQAPSGGAGGGGEGAAGGAADAVDGATLDGAALAAMKRHALSLLAAVASPAPPVATGNFVAIPVAARRRRLRRRRRRGSKTHGPAAEDDSQIISDSFAMDTMQVSMSPARLDENEVGDDGGVASEVLSASSDTASEAADEGAGGGEAGRVRAGGGVAAAGGVAEAGGVVAAGGVAAAGGGAAAGSGAVAAAGGGFGCVLRGGRGDAPRAPRRVAAL